MTWISAASLLVGFALTAHAITTGAVRRRRTTIRRIDYPLIFWVVVSIQFLLFVGVAVLFSDLFTWIMQHAA